MAVHKLVVGVFVTPETVFSYYQGGTLGDFDKKIFFACFVPDLLRDSLNIAKLIIFKSKQAKKIFLFKIPKGPPLVIRKKRF